MARQKFRPRGDLIVSLRKRLRLKQTAIALDLGISDKTLRGIEKGTTTIDRKRAMALAQNLQIANWQDLVIGAKGPELVSSNENPRPKYDEDRLVPRFDKTYVSPIKDAASLFAEAQGVLTIIPHFLCDFSEETEPYAAEAIEILNKVKRIDWGAAPELSDTEQSRLKTRLRELYVLLKGNDIGIYADTHWKHMPESDVVLEKPGALTEFQLILAFAPVSDDSVSVEVDNGQPFILPGKVSF